MTKLQLQMVKELSRCSFAPATAEKRFVRNLATKPKDYKLSERGLIYLAKIHYRFRKQIAQTQSRRST